LVNCIVLEVVRASEHLMMGTASNSGKIIVMANVNRYSNEIIQPPDRQTDRKQSHTLRSYRCHTESEGILNGWRKEQMGNPYLTA
jgi:hypothetical protein